ncbi:hypothetical protein NMY22_g7100 [Coprinellus aureogranulatus]|nr:hypothetical protein NMY22_g7100 [Coprinellus aureogranulatus]
MSTSSRGDVAAQSSFPGIDVGALLVGEMAKKDKHIDDLRAYTETLKEEITRLKSELEKTQPGDSEHVVGRRREAATRSTAQTIAVGVEAKKRKVDEGPPAVPRKRGRPRKIREEPPVDAPPKKRGRPPKVKVTLEDPLPPTDPPSAPRKRGRPRKYPATGTEMTGHTAQQENSASNSSLDTVTPGSAVTRRRSGRRFPTPPTSLGSMFTNPQRSSPRSAVPREDDDISYTSEDEVEGSVSLT